MKKLVFLLVILLFPTAACAKDIANPQVVSEMRATVIEDGTIDVSGAIYSLELNVSIPQESSYQSISNFQVYDSFGPCSTQSCSYDFVYDDYGNRLVRVKWKNPSGRLFYNISATVDITRRDSIEKRIIKDFIEPTSLVESANPQIIDLASQARGTDFEKVAYLAKWIGDNVEYDKVYSDESLSATEILSLRKGVCKEFSNLLVSFLRNLGYYSAVTVGYVHPGRIYDTFEFQPHGWVEVYADDGIVVDPVWAEVGYLDATHIKFATFPDSSWTFSSANANGLGDITVKLGENRVNISVIDFEEEPVINVTTSLLANNIWSGYAVLRTDLDANKCLLTRIEYKSCIDQRGNSFLAIVDPQNIVYFCGNKTVFTIFRLPDLDEKKNYRCDIQIFPYAGTSASEHLVMNPKGYGYSKLVLEKNVLLPGESFLATAMSSHIFTDYGDYGYGKANFTAPDHDFRVYSYNAGYLDSKNISVVLKRPIEVSLEVNDTASVGVPTQVIVNVSNLLSRPQNIKVIFKNNTVSEELSDSEYIVFNFTPQSASDNLVQVFVSTPDFSTSAAKVIDVKGGSIEVFDSLSKQISDFFSWLLSLFGVSL